MTERTDDVIGLSTCETDAAVAVHVRRVDSLGRRLSGGLRALGVRAACGARVSWDTDIPVSAVTCRPCLDWLERAKTFRQPRYDDVYMDGIDEWERAIAGESDSTEARTGRGE